MAESIYNSEIVECSYDGESQMVELKWKKNPNSEEYRTLFTTVRTFSKSHKIRFILSDMRLEGLVSIEDARWLDKEILSVVKSEKLQKLAMVIEDTIFAGAYTDMLKNKLGNSSVQVNIFNECNSARAWLLSE